MYSGEGAVHSVTCVWITLPFHSPPLTTHLPHPTCLPPTPPFPLPCSPLPPPPQGGPVQCAGLHVLHGVPLLCTGSRDAAATGEAGAGASRSVRLGGGGERRGWEEGLTTPVMCVPWMRLQHLCVYCIIRR